MPTRIMAQEGLQRALGPLQHHASRGTIASITAGWTKHPLGQLVGEQCLYLNLVNGTPCPWCTIPHNLGIAPHHGTKSPHRRSSVVKTLCCAQRLTLVQAGREHTTRVCLLIAQYLCHYSSVHIDHAIYVVTRALSCNMFVDAFVASTVPV